MSRRVRLPTDQDVAAALAAILDDAAADGARPTVVELARRVGLTNSTFWRHFPQTAHQLRDTARRPPPPAPGSPAAARHTELAQRAAALARDHDQLREQFDLAVANIARLTLDNHHLRQALEAADHVTPIHPRSRR